MRSPSGACGDLADMIARRRARSGAPVRRGHAGRRPGGLARRIEPDEAHLPGLRDHRRTDRAPPSGPGKDRPAGHHLVRPHLRCAAPARPGPCAAGGGLGRCGNRAIGYRPPRRFSSPHKRTNQTPMRLASVSPLAVPVLLEIGRELVHGAAREGLLREAAEELIAEAVGEGNIMLGLKPERFASWTTSSPGRSPFAAERSSPTIRRPLLAGRKNADRCRSAFRERLCLRQPGHMLPPYDTRADLAAAGAGHRTTGR